MPTPTSLLNPHRVGLEEYTPILPFEVLSERLGIAAEQIVKLDANEMLKRGLLKDFLDRAMPHDLTEYVGKTLTETDLERLKRRLIEGWSVDAKRVADGLYRVARLIAVPV
jgi:hypothetical protein